MARKLKAAEAKDAAGNVGGKSKAEKRPATSNPSSRAARQGRGAGRLMAPSALDLKDLIFTLRANSAYHSARRGFLDRCHRFLMFVVVFVGSAAFSGLVADYEYAKYVFALPAFAGLLDLVFDFMGNARDHENFYRRCMTLLADVDSSEATAEKFSDWKHRLGMIHADEPPAYRALFGLVWVEACIHYDRRDLMISVPWHHRLLRNIWPFDGADYWNSRKSA